MRYSIDFLYDYNNDKGQIVDRYLISFINDEEQLRSVEIEITDNDEDTICVMKYESDELNKQDRMLLYYILDKWAIERFLM